MKVLTLIKSFEISQSLGTNCLGSHGMVGINWSRSIAQSSGQSKGLGRPVNLLIINDYHNNVYDFVIMLNLLENLS